MSHITRSSRNVPAPGPFCPSATPVFRASRPDDRPAIQAIFHQGNLSLLEQHDSQAEEPAIGATFLHLLELNGEVLAALQWRDLGKEAEILDVAVPENHRRQGHAFRLLSEFPPFAGKRGVQDLFLEVRESNAAAIALYQKLGFAQSGRRPNYYHHPDEAALLLNLKLTA
ncbi:MAG TPA: GNAT family N-acetyltransferase [Candidatus Acidoferrum sp.]